MKLYIFSKFTLKQCLVIKWKMLEGLTVLVFVAVWSESRNAWIHTQDDSKYSLRGEGHRQKGKESLWFHIVNFYWIILIIQIHYKLWFNRNIQGEIFIKIITSNISVETAVSVLCDSCSEMELIASFLVKLPPRDAELVQGQIHLFSWFLCLSMSGFMTP